MTIIVLVQIHLFNCLFLYSTWTTFSSVLVAPVYTQLANTDHISGLCHSSAALCFTADKKSNIFVHCGICCQVCTTVLAKVIKKLEI